MQTGSAIDEVVLALKKVLQAPPAVFSDPRIIELLCQLCNERDLDVSQAVYKTACSNDSVQLQRTKPSHNDTSVIQYEHSQQTKKRKAGFTGRRNQSKRSRQRRHELELTQADQLSLAGESVVASQPTGADELARARGQCVIESIDDGFVLERRDERESIDQANVRLESAKTHVRELRQQKKEIQQSCANSENYVSSLIPASNSDPVVYAIHLHLSSQEKSASFGYTYMALYLNFAYNQYYNKATAESFASGYEKEYHGTVQYGIRLGRAFYMLERAHQNLGVIAGQPRFLNGSRSTISKFITLAQADKDILELTNFRSGWPIFYRCLQHYYRDRGSRPPFLECLESFSSKSTIYGTNALASRDADCPAELGLPLFEPDRSVPPDPVNLDDLFPPDLVNLDDLFPSDQVNLDDLFSSDQVNLDTLIPSDQFDLGF